MQLTPKDSRVYTAALARSAEMGGDIANYTDIVPVIQGAWLRIGGPADFPACADQAGADYCRRTRLAVERQAVMRGLTEDLARGWR
jgi:hypothetical protein